MITFKRLLRRVIYLLCLDLVLLRYSESQNCRHNKSTRSHERQDTSKKSCTCEFHRHVLLCQPTTSLEWTINPIGESVGVGFVFADSKVEFTHHTVWCVEGVCNPLHINTKEDIFFWHHGDVVGRQDITNNNITSIGKWSISTLALNCCNLGYNSLLFIGRYKDITCLNRRCWNGLGCFLLLDK